VRRIARQRGSRPIGLLRAQWIALVNAGNQIDFFFMLAYGGLLFVLTRRLLPEKRVWTNIAIGLGFTVPLVDLAQDVFIHEITGSIDADFAGALAALRRWFSWLKWLGLSALFATWVPHLWSVDRFGRAVGLIALLTLLTIGSFLASYGWRGRWAELMALGCALTVLGTSLVATRLARIPA
jgi:hypothetical protein